MNIQKTVLSTLLLAGSMIFAEDGDQAIMRALGGQSPYETGNLAHNSAGSSIGTQNNSTDASFISAYGSFYSNTPTLSSNYMQWSGVDANLLMGIDSGDSSIINIYQSGVYYVDYQIDFSAVVATIPLAGLLPSRYTQTIMSLYVDGSPVSGNMIYVFNASVSAPVVLKLFVDPTKYSISPITLRFAKISIVRVADEPSLG